MKNGPQVDPNLLVRKKRTFFWLNGKREVLDGDSVADALMNGGYNAGALHALDFVANGDNDDYFWQNGHWIKKTESNIQAHIQY